MRIFAAPVFADRFNWFGFGRARGLLRTARLLSWAGVRHGPGFLKEGRAATQHLSDARRYTSFFGLCRSARRTKYRLFFESTTKPEHEIRVRKNFSSATTSAFGPKSARILVEGKEASSDGRQIGSRRPPDRQDARRPQAPARRQW